MNAWAPLLWVLCFWGFVCVKAWGTAFAAWSWWWVLLPGIPWLFRALAGLGLL